ncbi:MAG: anhydro-N-acetylmuramic acid kinase [Chitinophagaceae bacterium]|nr:MAG: anhydro-N-acetylmuramic acid kinase [Chitinophagaceae bacterium]
MVYRAIGIVSGSSLNGLDLAFAEVQETSGRWTAEILAAERFPYTAAWKDKLRAAASLNVKAHLQLHIEYGRYIAETVRKFIDTNNLHFKVQLIACHGHTSVYDPAHHICSVLGDGATIAALTGINVVTDVRCIDLSLGGKGAPIYPIAEKLLFPDNHISLHLGANAVLSGHHNNFYQSLEVCPANKLLDMIAQRDDKPFDPAGAMAAEGKLDSRLLTIINELEYYRLPYPKTLSLDFASDVIYPLVDDLSLTVQDALRTVVEHIAVQVASAFRYLNQQHQFPSGRLMLTGGGANNEFLVSRIAGNLAADGVEIIVPDKSTVNFKESLAMALIGILRWREENNVFSYITGASRDSIGGAVWIGQEA